MSFRVGILNDFSRLRTLPVCSLVWLSIPVKTSTCSEGKRPFVPLGQKRPVIPGQGFPVVAVPIEGETLTPRKISAGRVSPDLRVRRRHLNLLQIAGEGKLAS